LFPYLLPSFPVHKNQCCSKEDIGSILESFDQWESSVYSLYVCTFLAEHRLFLDREKHYALRRVVHACNDIAIRGASWRSHKDTVKKV
jgi:hypothetical protein